MRITCPNCATQYEVDAGLIPEDGRDVQCSACAHTWMQYGDGRVEEISDDPDPVPETAELAPDTPAVPESDLDAPAEADAEDPDEGDAVAPVQRRELDEDSRRILREEAQREAARRRARRGTAPETQPDPGPADPSPKRPAPDTEEAEADPAPLATAEDAPTGPRRRRSGVFPDIEEINSTLSAGDEANRDQGAGASGSGAGAFRTGFLLMLGLAVLIMALYLAAPQIAARLPALESEMAAYVSGVNSFRMAVEGLLQGAAEWIDSLSA